MDKKGAIIVAIFIVAAGALSWYLRWHEVRPSDLPDFSSIPLTLGDWTGKTRELSKEEQSILRANDTFIAEYRTPTSTPVELYIAYFTSQKYGSAIHSPRNCLPGSGWIISSLRKAHWMLGDRRIKINKMLIARPEAKYMVYYWYLTRSGEISGEIGLKFDLIKNSLSWVATDGALIRVSAPIGGPLNDSPDIQDFLKKFSKYIYSSLPLGG